MKCFVTLVYFYIVLNEFFFVNSIEIANDNLNQNYLQENELDSFSNATEPEVSVKCWQNSNECNINANIILKNGEILPVSVDCRKDALNFRNPSVAETKISLQRRYQNAFEIFMDGCETSSDLKTFGLTFLSYIVNKIRLVQFTNFNLESIQPGCFNFKNTLEHITFLNNQIYQINSDSFDNLANIKTLNFYNNNLKNIEDDTFSTLMMLREITLSDENYLNLKNADIFRNTSVETITIHNVQLINAFILTSLPLSLESINISSTAMDKDDITIQNPGNIKNLTATKNALYSLTLNDGFSIIWLNLSLNGLEDVFLENCTMVKVLDLSKNRLAYLRDENFRQMEHLESIFLQNNRFKSLTMETFRSSYLFLNLIDLSRNQLQKVDMKENYIPNQHIRLLVNENPFNCLWLLKYSNDKPEQFRIFKYIKFISKINVNGLECIVYPEKRNQTYMAPSTEVPEFRRNLSLFPTLPGQPRDVKKSQRNEALIIVFLLPLGMAFLGVLLYLWLYCQKMFHWSFYRSLPIIRGSADRFDVIRQVPSNTTSLKMNNNQGYEVPRSCVNNLCSDPQCTKNCQVTYEEIPRNVKIYEEIDEAFSRNNENYDQLKYRDKDNS